MDEPQHSSSNEKYESFIKDQFLINKAITNEIVKNQSNTECEIEEIHSVCQDICETIKVTDSQVQHLTNTLNYVCEDMHSIKRKQNDHQIDVNDLIDDISEKTNVLSAKIIALENESKLKDAKINELNKVIEKLVLKFELSEEEHNARLTNLNNQKNNSDLQIDSLSNIIKGLSTKLDDLTNKYNDITSNMHKNAASNIHKNDTSNTHKNDTPKTPEFNFRFNDNKNAINENVINNLNLNENMRIAENNILFVNHDELNNKIYNSKLNDNLHNDIRKIRGCTQNILLKDIHVCENKSVLCEIIGTTGNMYFVELVGKPCCTCADFANHNVRCKHIYYVLEKILGVKNSAKERYSFNELTKAENYRKML